MKIFIDESIHDEYGFMLLAFVMCKADPSKALSEILNRSKIDEYHSAAQMKNNAIMQNIRSELKNYINSKCYWGIMVLPNNNRQNIMQDFSELIEGLVKALDKNEVDIYVDEGIVNSDQTQTVKSKYTIKSIQLVDSKVVQGIQLADLVAALCGVRLREEISGKAKKLTYGQSAGFDPPIEANIGYEFWASLRHSMMNSNKPEGEEMPEMACFDTKGFGLLISKSCSTKLEHAAEKVFGEVYLGCIH